MKNLKLLNACLKTTVEADNFCHDLEDNIYFASCKGLNRVAKYSHEVTFCSEFDPEEQEHQHHVIGIEYLIESNSIFIAFSSGNLYLYDAIENQVNNIGIVDNGIEEFSWSPDQEFLVLLTAQNSFVLMTREFDPIIEKDNSCEEFGKSEPINVGWGSKTTQFHGSEGKGAALVKNKEPAPALSYDDQRPRISWRNDGEYFVISSIAANKGFRQLRIWSKDGVLQFTGEIINNIEEPLSWRPTGDLIVCSQHCPDQHKIIFVEKNGLKHGEFPLPFKPLTFQVTILSWSNDSSILAVAAKERSDISSEFQVLLWTMGNYHWYLKQKFCIQNCPLPRNLVIKWNSNEPLRLNCYNQCKGEFFDFKWTLTTIHSPSQYECDDSVVISIDNENILVSPLGKLVVPPPLCGYKFTLTSPILSVFFAPDKPAFGAYLGNHRLAIFSKDLNSQTSQLETSTELNDCELRLVAAGGNGFKPQVRPYNFKSIYNIKMDLPINQTNQKTLAYFLTHWTWIKNNSLLCVHCQERENNNVYSILFMTLNSDLEKSADIIARSIVDLTKSVISMSSNENGSMVAVQLEDGEVNYINIDEIINTSNESNMSLLHPWKETFSDTFYFNPPRAEMCIVNKTGEKEFLAGLASNGDFEFKGLPATQFVTSYFIQGGFLFYTTTSHLLHIHQFDVKKQNGKKFPDTEQKVERNAKLVFVPPNSTKVILQMPRGNLETIHPRPLVLGAIFEHLDKLEFHKAFELAKVHRIDLNVLYDYNPKVLLKNVKLFINQLDSKDLNLFLANLKIGNVCIDTYNLQYDFSNDSEISVKETFFSDKVNLLCDKIREVLDPDVDKHFLPYLATYALKKPPCLDEALQKIKCVKDSSNSKKTQDIVNKALDFLLYLVDVNELIDVAFGTYDLETTIMVAQKSQKDPKEFLPFYNELQKLEDNYRKYKIDMHLHRYKKALIHIGNCDLENHFKECLQLIKEKKLFVDALYLFPFASKENKIVWTEYGQYLESKAYFDEAGLVYSRIEADELAFKAFRESGNWKECLNIAYKCNYSNQKILGTCQYMVERLKDKQKYLEAGYLLEHIIKDIEEAVVTLIEGCEWSSATLLMSKYQRLDISETHLKPSLVMLHKTLIPELDLMLNDFNVHLCRLKYLRSPEKRKLDQEVAATASKYVDDDQFSEVTSVSDIASSRSESARLSGSIMTRKSSKSRRKQQLKKYRLKEGSPDEDLALIVALSEIIRKVDGLKDNFLNNIRVLVQHGYDDSAKEIQFKMQALVSLIETEMPYIWSFEQATEPQTQWSFGPNSTVNTITASRINEDKSSNPIKTDPQLAAPPWRNMDIFLNMLKSDVKCK